MNDNPDRKHFPEKFGLIGYSVTHSLSPAIFKFIFHEFCIKSEYRAWDVLPDKLAESVNELRLSSAGGFNVTIPHKSSVMGLLDHIDETAERIGAVNCVLKTGGRLIGYNTDYLGVIRTIEPFLSELHGESILLMGSGGAARAVIYALMHHAEPDRIYVWSRNPENARNLALQFADPGKYGKIQCAHLSGNQNPGFRKIINCLPPEPFAAFIREHAEVFLNCDWIFDVNYNSGGTEALYDISGKKPVVINGLNMLIYQAAESFRIWTGLDFPYEELTGKLKKRILCPESVK